MILRRHFRTLVKMGMKLRALYCIQDIFLKKIYQRRSISRQIDKVRKRFIGSANGKLYFESKLLHWRIIGGKQISSQKFAVILRIIIIYDILSNVIVRYLLQYYVSAE